MADKPGLLDYVTAAFNARPFGMIVAPNWIGLAAVGLLGLVEPGVWVLGAGVELGYLLLLAGNERFRRVVDAQRGATVSPHDELTGRIARGLLTLDPRERARYQTVAERCQSIIELQIAHAPGVVGVEAQQEGLSRLTWMYLRLLLARQAIERVHRDIASTRDLPGTLARLERRLATEPLDEQLRRSVEGQADILRQRIAHRADAERQMTYIDSELARIEHQVELIREQAALSTDPVVLSQRIDEIAATLGGTAQWIRDQQQIFGGMEDLLLDTAAPGATSRARETE
jgi:hypothetical protein